MLVDAQRDSRPVEYTPWAIKRSQHIFVCKFVKNQRISMQFSPLDFEMNDKCEAMNFTHLA